MEPQLSCKTCDLQIGANDTWCPHCGSRNWRVMYSDFWKTMFSEALMAVVILAAFAYLSIR